MIRGQYEVNLLCGGEGIRLRSLTGDVLPKPLVKIGGKELMRYSIEPLPIQAVSKLVFAVDYQEKVVIDWVQEASLPFPCIFSRQKTAGVLSAISSASEHLSGTGMVVCNADEIRQGIDMEAVLAFHEASPGLATMVAAPAVDLYRYRVLTIGEDNIVTDTLLKGERYRQHPEVRGAVNTGLLVLSPGALNYADPLHSTGWSGLIDPLVQARQLQAYVDPNVAYFNVGTVEEYREAEAYLEQHA